MYNILVCLTGDLFTGQQAHHGHQAVPDCAISSASHSLPDQLVVMHLQATSFSLCWVVLQQDMLCYDLYTVLEPTQPAFASQPCSNRRTCSPPFISITYNLMRAKAAHKQQIGYCIMIIKKEIMTRANHM